MSIESPNHTLLIDTSNRWILTGIFGPEISLESVQEAPRDSFRLLMPSIQRILSESRLPHPDRIVVLRGPGSFTGTRIGVGAARNLAQLWKIPVTGIDSLAAYAHHCRGGEEYGIPEECPTAIALDAKQKKVYARIIPPGAPPAEYHKTELLDIGPEDLIRLLPEGCPVLCDDPATLRSYMKEGEARTAAGFVPMKSPSPSLLYEYFLLLEKAEELAGEGEWQSLTPRYLRNDPAHEKYPQGYNKT